MQFFRTLIARIVRFVRRMLTPSTTRIIGDFEKKIAQLNKVVDAENDAAAEAVERRTGLRRAIDQTYVEENEALDRAVHASRIRANLENIIRA